VIRIRLAELVAEKAFREGRRIERQEVALQTGIHRVTLSKMQSERGYNATLANVDLLCKYFNCAVGELLEYVRNEDLEVPLAQSFKGPVKTSVAKSRLTAKRRAPSKRDSKK